MTESGFWSLHTHTRYSKGDATGSVARTVHRASELGYDVLGVVDHGTLSGGVQTYRACRQAGIEPLLGVEAYLVIDRSVVGPKRPTMYHALLVAFDLTGYRNLVTLVNASWRHHRWYPLIDLADLAEAAARNALEGILMTGGCWFGLVPKLLRENPSAGVLNVVEALSGWFDGRFFIEIQNHRVSDASHNDPAHAQLLHDMAVSLHLPTVLCQDSHYVDINEQPLHDAFKMLTAHRSNDPSEAVFPGDGYHMVGDAWMRAHHPPSIYRRGIAGLAQIRSWANLRIPELERYRLRVPDLSSTGSAQADLARLVTAALEARIDEQDFSSAVAKRYRRRLTEELAVVNATGFAGYLLLVARVCLWMLDNRIRFSVRGSAAGSLLVWLLRIVSIDPVAWGLSFDRFLSVDRIKPPDIDLDIEHERRDEVLTWVMTTFDAVQIGTFAQYGLNENDSGEPGGLLMVDWRARARWFGADPGAPLPDVWRAKLKAIATINGARGNGAPIDPPLRSIGVHPSGVLIAPDAPALAEVPVQYVSSSKTFVTAYDQHDIDHIGMVKLDLLGLRTLTVLRVCEEMTGIRHDELATNDRKVFTAMAKDTTGLFQLEGGSSTRGVRRMKPNRIADVIASMALFRPAAQNSGATNVYLRRRSGEEVITKHHPLIEKHLEGTYGVPIYQEQAIGILKDLGLTIAEVEAARKAIKASNAHVDDAAEVLAGLMATIDARADEHGLSEVDKRWLREALDAYAGYSFNLAHATAYGLVCYATAWYRLYRPVAFWTGTLRAFNDAPPRYKDSPAPELIYLNAAKRAHIQIRSAHVNVSGPSYSSDGRHIYKGLTSIKGVGTNVAQAIAERAPYSSLDDFARRVPPKTVTGARALGRGIAPVNCPGIVRALYNDGALEGIEREITPPPKESDDTGATLPIPELAGDLPGH